MPAADLRDVGIVAAAAQRADRRRVPSHARQRLQPSLELAAWTGSRTRVDARLSGRARSSARARSGSRCLTAPVARLAEHPIAESDCHRSRPVGTEAVWAPAHAVPAEGPPRSAVRPIAGSGCRHRFPAGPEAAAPNGVRHAVPAEGLAPGPGLLVRQSSVRWSWDDRANAAPSVPHKPARPRASAPLQWSEVCESYSSPEQQFCHRTPHTFLEKVTDRVGFYARAVHAGYLWFDIPRGQASGPPKPRRAKPASYTGL